MDREEIRMPDDPARLNQHSPVDVFVTLRTGRGEDKAVLAGRCSTQHLRPNGVIVVVKPQLPANHVPLRRSDTVHARFKRSEGETLEANGTVSWVRPKAFLPSGMAVSLFGITFDWDPEENALTLAAFLSRPSLAPKPG